jgi:hypothetical protein
MSIRGTHPQFSVDRAIFVLINLGAVVQATSDSAEPGILGTIDAD